MEVMPSVVSLHCVPCETIMLYYTLSKLHMHILEDTVLTVYSSRYHLKSVSLSIFLNRLHKMNVSKANAKNKKRVRVVFSEGSKLNI